MIAAGVIKSPFDRIEHGFQLFVGQGKCRSSVAFFCFLPTIFQLSLLIAHTALNYTRTIRVAVAAYNGELDLRISACRFSARLIPGSVGSWSRNSIRVSAVGSKARRFRRQRSVSINCCDSKKRIHAGADSINAAALYGL